MPRPIKLENGAGHGDRLLGSPRESSRFPGLPNRPRDDNMLRAELEVGKRGSTADDCFFRQCEIRAVNPPPKGRELDIRTRESPAENQTALESPFRFPDRVFHSRRIAAVVVPSFCRRSRFEIPV